MDKLPSAAAELVALPVDMIFAVGTPAAQAAVRATKTIPIVFARVGNPVTVGLVSSSAHPGGNATGVTVFTTELPGKRMQILKDLVPGLSRVAVLHEPKFLPGQLEVKQLTALASALKLEFYFVGVDSLTALEGAADEIMKGSPQALFVGSSGWFEDNYQLPINAAAKAHLPGAVCTSRVRRRRRPCCLWRTVPRYVSPGRRFQRSRLKGAAPGDLPVENPVRFELVVNRKTARALGLNLPLSIVTIADEVIE